MKVLFIASEATPFIKTGGLGDVLGSLPKALHNENQNCIVILPKYRDLLYATSLSFVTEFTIWFGFKKQCCSIYTAIVDKITFYFIDHQQYFNTHNIYGYGDDYERFVFFDVAAMKAIRYLQLKPDIIHLHDWQTALIALLYKEKYNQYRYYKDIKIVFTIHNLAYQGKANPSALRRLFGVDALKYLNKNCFHNGYFNIMKSGLIYSDIITTVSPTYAKEILTKEYGESLEAILQTHQNKLYGILNGVDDGPYSPNNSSHQNLTIHRKKQVAKLALQKECHLPINKDIACIGMVTRLTWQKGLDLILQKINIILNQNIQLIILGVGDNQYEQALHQLQKQYPRQISFQQKYDENLAQRIYAGIDMFLMPSLFEPCGLSQMIALQHASIPIVRNIGGLRDSIRNYTQSTKQANGFTFDNYSANEMVTSINRALTIYYEDKKTWQKLMIHAISNDFSWEQSAKQYLVVYKKLMQES